MIELSQTISNILEGYTLNFFYLVSIRETDHYTSASHDILMENGITYISDGGLFSVESPRMSSTVDRASYKIAFTDPTFAMKSYFESGATGDKITVRLGFYNTLGEIVDGVEPGDYFPQMANTIVAYQGVVDSHMYDINIAEGSSIATIEGSSPMADLDLVKSFFTNKESMKIRNPDDTAFRDVFSGSGAISLKWGKK